MQVEHLDWGQTTTTVDGPLPAPVTEAIERWRRLDLDADLQHTVTELKTAGYRIHCAARDSI